MYINSINNYEMRVNSNKKIAHFQVKKATRSGTFHSLKNKNVSICVQIAH